MASGQIKDKAMKITIDISKKYLVDQKPARFLELIKYLYSGDQGTIDRCRQELTVYGVTLEDEDPDA